MKNSTTRFSDRVSNYTKFRPSYPKSAIEYICSEYKVSAESVVADVGSGTGIFTNQILPFVKSVFAVEPNAEMRRVAENQLGNSQKFKSLGGTSENTGIPDQSIDFIFAAQAAHWFDLEKTKKEFLRILRPNGVVFLIWNKRQMNTSFLQEYEKLVQAIPGYSEVTHQNLTESILRTFLGSTFRCKTFPNSQKFNFEGLLGRFSSSSYTPAEGSDEYFEIKRKLEELFHGTSVNGEISFNYETEVYSGKIV
jgi:SAM-dependent methyltransferase